MGHTQTENSALEAMSQGNPDEPVVMLNMLKYREIAESGFGVDGMTGEAAYRPYSRSSPGRLTAD